MKKSTLCSIGKRRHAVVSASEGDLKTQARRMSRQHKEIYPSQIQTLNAYKDHLKMAKAAMDEHLFECMECK